ncbi:hypothetical protein ACOMHN_065518 [Nucella lapillus]
MAMQQAGHATPEIFDGETQRADKREDDKSLVMNEDLQNEEVTANNDDTIANTTTLDNTVTDAECPCGERKASNGRVAKETVYNCNKLSATKLLQPKKPTPDAVLIHVGTKDLKSGNAGDAAPQVAATTNKLLSDHPNIKVVISEITTTNRDLFAKAKLHNATVFAALHGEERVSFVDHSRHSRPRTKATEKETASIPATVAPAQWSAILAATFRPCSGPKWRRRGLAAPIT